MIITRTPFRISFFGGGTDYPVWYREHRGAVLSTTINKYCFIDCRYLPPFFNYKYRIRYTAREETNSISEIKHPSVRECIKYVSIDDLSNGIKGIEMVHTSDIPAQSGVGSSSAFTVGFLNSLYALKGDIISKRELAEDAINLEQNIIKENVGSQDQIAASFGGLNKIEFGNNKNGREFDIHPMTLGKDKLNNLENHLMLFFTGFQRNASTIAEEQIKTTPKNTSELNTMLNMVDNAVDILKGSDSDITEFGKLMDNAWSIKRKLTKKITNPQIDQIYKRAMDSGAIGGKLLGAGGGGCMLFCVEPENQNKVREALSNLVYIPFKFENQGSQVIYYDPHDEF